MSISAFINGAAIFLFACVSIIGALTGFVVPNGLPMVYIAVICFSVICINMWLFDIAFSLRKLNNLGITTKD